MGKTEKSVAQLTPQEQDKLVAEFVQKQKEKAEASIQKRAAELSEQLKTRSTDFVLLYQKRHQLQVAADRLNAAKAEKKQLLAEIKAIRVSMKAKRDGKVMTKTA